MKTFFTFFLISLLLIAPLAYAVDDYILLESIADFTAKDPAPDLSTYLQGIFIWIIRVAAILAVLSLVYAGVEYTASGVNETLKNNAKKRIIDTGWGLLGVIGGYFILQLVNPALVNFQLDIPEINVGGEAPSQPSRVPTSYQPRLTSQRGVVMSDECNDCGSMSEAGIPVKADQGNDLNKGLIAKLQRVTAELQGKNIPWHVTEGYPPKVEHTSTCHADGTCFDANTRGGGVAGLNAFFEAARSAGLDATYEVLDETAFRNLQGSGYKGTMKATGTKDPHFHVK